MTQTRTPNGQLAEPRAYELGHVLRPAPRARTHPAGVARELNRGLARGGDGRRERVSRGPQLSNLRASPHLDCICLVQHDKHGQRREARHPRRKLHGSLLCVASLCLPPRALWVHEPRHANDQLLCTMRVTGGSRSAQDEGKGRGVRPPCLWRGRLPAWTPPAPVQAPAPAPGPARPFSPPLLPGKATAAEGGDTEKRRSVRPPWRQRTAVVRFRRVHLEPRS